MNRIKRLFYIILANILISATTTLTVLYLWEKNRSLPQAQVTVVVMVNPTAKAALDAGTPLAVVLEGTPTPASLQEQEPGLSPTPTQVIVYRVKEGDTLSKIALNFDASIDDIMILNGLSDPNLISVGEILYIPTGPLPTSTPIPPTTAAPSATPGPMTPTPSRSPTPPPTGNPPRPVIESILGAGDLDSERIRITRSGHGVLNLAGWQLEDGNGHVYIFPKLNLFEGGVVHLHTTKGLDTATNLYWGLSEPAWQAGEIVILRDEQGLERARYQVP